MSKYSEIEDEIKGEYMQILKIALKHNQEELLSEEMFVQLVVNYSMHNLKNEEKLRSFFKKIDLQAQDRISWKQICEYLYNYQQNEDTKMKRWNHIEFILPPIISKTILKQPVIKIFVFNRKLVTVFQNGLLTFWKPDLKPEKVTYLMPSISSDDNKMKLIMDVTIMEKICKLMVITGNGELQFYSLISLAPYCQIVNLFTMPVKIDSRETDANETVIAFGDLDGYVNILTFYNIHQTLSIWKRCAKQHNIPSISLLEVIESQQYGHYARIKAHGDMVQQIQYAPFMNPPSVITCCNDTRTALVIISADKHQSYNGEQSSKKTTNDFKTMVPCSDQQTNGFSKRVFIIHNGVKTFTISFKRSIIITGGMDKIIRIWDIHYSNHPFQVLSGHDSPIIYLHLSEEDNKLFSISYDKMIKVWDPLHFSQLAQVSPKVHGISGSSVTCCSFIHQFQTLYLATDYFNVLPTKIRWVQMEIQSHPSSVLCCIYNPNTDHVISGDADGTIRIWDLETGNLMNEFCHSPNVPVNCLCLDSINRRLISAGNDGIVKVWNFHNSQLLQQLQKESDVEEIYAVVFATKDFERFIITSGLDHRVSLYLDIPDSVAEFQRPLKTFPTSFSDAHKDCILSMDFSPPDYLATGDANGKIILWKIMGISVGTLISLAPQNYKNFGKEELIIKSLIFLNRGVSGKKQILTLISSGPWGHIHFWKIGRQHVLLGMCKACERKESVVTSLVINQNKKLLFSADSKGFICGWDISSDWNRTNNALPSKLVSWRAHTESITSLSLIDSKQMVVSSSYDNRLRLWTMEGKYVGMFSLSNNWNIYEPTTFIHPQIPHEVLIDPLSLPEHHYLKKRVPEKTIKTKVGYIEAKDLSDDNEYGDTVLKINRKIKLLGKRNNMLTKFMRDRKIQTGVNIPMIYRFFKCTDLQPICLPNKPSCLRQTRKSEAFLL